MTIYGYDINTGEPITNYRDRLVHIGNGSYEKLSSISIEDRKRRYKFSSSISLEVSYKKIGFEEH